MEKRIKGTAKVLKKSLKVVLPFSCANWLPKFLS